MADASRRSSGSSWCGCSGNTSGQQETQRESCDRRVLGVSPRADETPLNTFFAKPISASDRTVSSDDCGDVLRGGATTLTAEQQLVQRKSQVELMIENERYLRHHAELQEMLALFMTKVLEDKPNNILKFAGEFFTQDGLKELVEAQADEEDTYSGIDEKLEEV
ncbi:hypothetical protein TGRUB_273065 [Toxoplasma gondii RUB]|uniref:RIIa domain-containing protein n=9 Tax=Toxoplasma gondii TaxID=5811 RepID=S7V3B4_TOXGG|nr:hypothetical protein TGGT1_273065 [Toxoplasma gondii GT1]KAF4642074.1 hypothetical protein TGRH88_078870 [Toxoplasma gondii]KFG43068.1 hypothetical protein TGDOM2_273065 [Toxoplasma gondii GAB2-2007-GAL-DOM2]KFG50162.1 hypothetical protein TGFOU_273065 [Toxoplasma gondii FOU]KFG51715.1 hypothetical protein TGP89_273065 [Toxoplasma gondii p89]KFG64074.1 hypothetical protein TGRUB_273065 [Toxoplasma gondii RUB]KFH11682.1 hypothetical protein TGVAND_273065 [Toxoplasma gondii VAND]PUA92356.1 